MEVSCFWDETPSFTNARNVQRSIWFCFFQLPPLSTAWVLRRGLQPSLDVPSAKRLCHHGDSSVYVCVRVCVCVVAVAAAGWGAWGWPPLSSQAKPCGARSPWDPCGSGAVMRGSGSVLIGGRLREGLWLIRTWTPPQWEVPALLAQGIPSWSGVAGVASCMDPKALGHHDLRPPRAFPYSPVH